MWTGPRRERTPRVFISSIRPVGRAKGVNGPITGRRSSECSIPPELVGPAPVEPQGDLELRTRIGGLELSVDCAEEAPFNDDARVAAALEADPILEHYDLKALGHNSADYLHVVTEAMKMGYADRDSYYAALQYLAAKHMPYLERVPRIAEERLAEVGWRMFTGPFNPAWSSTPSTRYSPKARAATWAAS